MIRPHLKYMTALLLVMLINHLTLQARDIKSLTTSDGLSDMLVNVIYKDSTGFVWLGTETALDRYDGNNIKTFCFPDDSKGLRRVNAITEIHQGHIYVGNHQGLFTMSANSRQLERVCANTITFPVNALAHDGKGTLWAGTRQGLFRYDTRRNSIRPVLLGADILSQDNEVSGIWVDPQGSDIWASSLFTLHHYDPATDKVTDFHSPVQGPIMRMTAIGDTLYLGTRGSGVIPFVKSQQTFLTPIELGNNIITSICPSCDGALIVVTDGEGIFKYDVLQHKIINHHSVVNSKLRSNSVYAIYSDLNGLYWIGYYQNGVDYTPWKYELFETYAHPGVIDTQHHEVRSLSIDEDIKLIGTRDGLYYIDESSGRTAVFRKPQIDSNLIFCITMWKGLYYIGTYGGGAYVLNPKNLSINKLSIPSEGGIIFDNQIVFNITVGPDNNLWIGSSSGLYRLSDNTQLTRYDSTNSRLPEGNVYDIFFDSAGRGWISTENGMAIWDGTTLRTDRFPRGFINSQKIRDVFEDRDHNLYFAPDRGDVFKSNFELTHFGPVQMNTKGLHVMTTFITEDNDGWIWFGTDKGLIRYDKKDKVQHFNIASGLPSLIFTLCPPYKDNNGDIWMGNTKGLLRLDFRKLREMSGQLRPSINITDMSSNGQSVFSRISNNRDGRLLKLDSKETDLEVSFSNFSYMSPEYYSVEYILEGYDDEWRITDGRSPIHYFGLPAGKYVLRVRQLGDPSTETAMRIHKSAGIGRIATYIIIALAAICAGLMTYRTMRPHHEATTAASATSSDDDQTQAENVAIKQRYKTTRLSDEECKRLSKTLDQVMRTSRPYKNPDLKISDLAKLAGTSAHALSFLFNQYMQKSYYDYVNTYRVDEFKRLIKETDTSKYTLTAMSQMCGFSSRASFFRHFKAITGITPAEYMKG